MRNKRLLAFVLAGTTALGLAGCGSAATGSSDAVSSAASAVSELSGETSSETVSSAASENTASGEAVSLSFYIWSDEENYIRKVVDAYNAEHDNVNVELNVIASNDYDDKLKVMLAGDTDVDLVDIRGVAQMTQYAEQGSLLDITDRITESGLDTSKYGDMWATSDADGKYYVLPTRTTCWALFYNKDLLWPADLGRICGLCTKGAGRSCREEGCGRYGYHGWLLGTVDLSFLFRSAWRICRRPGYTVCAEISRTSQHAVFERDTLLLCRCFLRYL